MSTRSVALIIMLIIIVIAAAAIITIVCDDSMFSGNRTWVCIHITIVALVLLALTGVIFIGSDIDDLRKEIAVINWEYNEACNRELKGHTTCVIDIGQDL